MRVLFTSLIASSVVLIHVLDNPGRVSNGLEAAKQRAISFLNTKEIRIDGLKLVPRDEVERVLPLSRSVGWWMMNETSIKARIAENPWIKGVQMSACKGAILPKFGCFQLSIEERDPRFLALVDDERWIIGEDGALIIPAKGSAPGLTDERFSKLIPLYGLASRVTAPERFQAQLQLAQTAIRALEVGVGLPVESITFEGRGDLSVDFSSLPFPVVFGAPSVDALPVIEDQGQRLKALLAQLKDRLNDIQRIDLAFSKVGVVKFRPPQPEEN
jgi:POTRA domain, FtsQ-type